MELILLALQSNSTGSVLINDGMLGAGIKKLKPGAAAPGVSNSRPSELFNAAREVILKFLLNFGSIATFHFRRNV